MFDTDKTTGEMWIYDEITQPGYGGIDAGTFIDALKSMGDVPITVRINSPGGDVDEGVAIYNALSRHSSTVTTVNDSLAASIANYIFMAGNERLVAANSRSMIHEPWTIAMGNATGLRKTADILDSTKDTLAAVYVEKMGTDSDRVSALMADETWFTADEAIEAGMATAPAKMVAVAPIRFAAGLFRHPPKDLIENKEAGSNNPRFPIRQRYENLFKKYKNRH